MSFDLVLRHGRVVDPSQDIDRVADVAFSGGAVAAIGDRLDTTGADVRDVGGMIVTPGLIDLHTHFLPPRVMAKVRAQFDAAGPLIGRPWPLHYRDEDDALVEVLRSYGVRRFTALPYAHKPGMAEFLNDWAAGFAERVPEAAVCGTFFPEPGVASYVASRTEAVEVWKVHVQVGDFTVTDPALDGAWGIVAEAGTPVVLHAGSGPVPACGIPVENTDSDSLVRPDTRRRWSFI